MATISSSTTTVTPTPTQSASSVVSNAAQSLLTSLNTGSGVDTASLVTSLVQAQFAARTAALTAKTNALTAQISAASNLKSTISGFSTALNTLVSGGTLQGQPTSSNANVLTATAIAGGKIGKLSSSITVNALATPQMVRTTAPVADRTKAIGSGTFTLNVGTASYDADGGLQSVDGKGGSFTFSVKDASLDGIASAINAAKTGVTASVIADADGKAYLSLKGDTGTAQAFTLATDSADLAQFNVGGPNAPTAITSKAANASLVVDGIAVQRGSNTISDLITGVKLQLTGISGAADAPVTLASQRPTSSLIQAVQDIVETYNQVFAAAKTATDAKDGDLKSDGAAKTLLRSLQSLTTKTLVPGATAGAPSTLAQLGVATNRDGTLMVDANALAAAVAKYPDEVEAMFAATSSNAIGLPSVLSGIALAASSSTIGLGASASRYTKAQSDLSVEKDKITDQSASMTTRLTQQFSSMNAKVSAYKSTQTFLDNQIKAWNSDN